MSQQRDHFRLQARLPVLVCSQDSEIPISTYTLDIGGGGFLLAGPDTLLVGERIRFKLTLAPGDPPVSGAGTVVRRDARSRCSVAFDSLSSVDERRVVRFVFDAQRDQRRREVEMERRHER